MFWWLLLAIKGLLKKCRYINQKADGKYWERIFLDKQGYIKMVLKRKTRLGAGIEKKVQPVAKKRPIVRICREKQKTVIYCTIQK